MATIKKCEQYIICDVCKKEFQNEKRYFVGEGGSTHTFFVGNYDMLKKVFELRIKWVGTFRFGHKYVEVCENCATEITKTLNKLRQ